jgi:hypothetical protein
LHIPHGELTGKDFNADVAPSNPLRMIPHINERMVPFATIIPQGYNPNEYTLDDLPHRVLNINHPHHQVKIVFGNILLITGDTIHQDTTNTGNERGLHPTLTASIFISKVDSYLAENKLSNCPIDPIELTPLNTMYMPIHKIKVFILYQKRQVLDFLKCAIPHLDHLRIHVQNPDNLQTSAEFRECYDFLNHSHEYLFPFELSLSREYFTGLIATSPSTISQDPHFNNPFPPYQPLSHNPKSVLFRRYLQLNSSLGNEQIGHFQWLKPVFEASGSLEPSPQQLQSPTTLKRTPSDMIF